MQSSFHVPVVPPNHKEDKKRQHQPRQPSLPVGFAVHLPLLSVGESERENVYNDSFTRFNSVAKQRLNEQYFVQIYIVNERLGTP